MAYNAGFPMSYQGMYYPQQYQQPAQQAQQPTTSSIIWVQGEAGAKSYMVAPNTTVQLWDSENQTIYLKSADASGMPSIKTLDYTIREAANAPAAAQVMGNDYATKADIEALRNQIEALKAQIREAKHE